MASPSKTIDAMNNSLLIFLVGQLVVITTALIRIYTMMMLKLKELDLRVAAVEKQDDELKKKLDTLRDGMYEKLDDIWDKINELGLEIQNKQNRT